MNEALSLLLDNALSVVAALLLVMGRQAIAHLADWLKLRADSEVRTYLMDGLQRAVEFGQAEARRQLQGVTTEAARERLHGLTVELASKYAVSRWPDALARFQIDAPALEAMVKARLPSPPRPFGG